MESVRQDDKAIQVEAQTMEVLSTPKGVLRFALRLPVYLYRIGFGRLFGHRFLLLVHRGRRSGRVYRTTLEVVCYDEVTRESMVLSAWGERSDWYRNIRQEPALEIQTGGGSYVPKQRFLTPEENHAVVSSYARRHPVSFRLLAKTLGYPLSMTALAPQRIAESSRSVAFSPAKLTATNAGDAPQQNSRGSSVFASKTAGPEPHARRRDKEVTGASRRSITAFPLNRQARRRCTARTDFS